MAKQGYRSEKGYDCVCVATVTFKSHFYLVNTVVFCKYLHFMFLVNFTIALASYYVIWLSLVSDYGIFWGCEEITEISLL